MEKQNKKLQISLSSECCRGILLGLGSQSRDDYGRNGANNCPLLPSHLPSTAHKPSLEEGVGAWAKGCLMSFWGMVFREGRQRKETVHLRTALLILLDEICNPKQSQERHQRNSLLNQSHNLLFSQQPSFLADVFPWVGEAPCLSFQSKLRPWSWWVTGKLLALLNEGEILEISNTSSQPNFV